MLSHTVGKAGPFQRRGYPLLIARWISLLGSVALVCVLCQSCKLTLGPGTEDDKKTVERAIEEFHQRYNSLQYEELYQDCDVNFRATNTLESFSETTAKIHDQFGNVQGVTRSWVNVIADPIPTARAVYHTRFEKGDATEMSTWNLYRGKATLLYYQVYPGTIAPGSDAKGLER